MRDSNPPGQTSDWLYYYHRSESEVTLFEKTAHYAMQLMCWADQMEFAGLQLHAFNMAPSFYEVLISGGSGDCQSSMHRALSQFLTYRQQSGTDLSRLQIHSGDWAIEHIEWAEHARQALDARSKDPTGNTVISSWHYPQCSLLSTLGSSPAAGLTHPKTDTRLRPLRLD